MCGGMVLGWADAMRLGTHSRRSSKLPAILLFIVVGSMAVVGAFFAWKEFRTPSPWRSIGGLGDQKTHRFVEVDPARAKQRSNYDEAAKSICKDRPHNNLCVIAFFLPGDRVPERQPAAAFFKAGGWANYAPLAIYSQNERTGAADFTHWDCDRAGEEGAPLAALCGPGIKDAYAAVQKVAARAGMAEGCNWPKNQDASLTATYIAALANPERRTQFKEAFDRSFAGAQKGADEKGSCIKQRAKFEEEADQARRTLGFPAPPPPPDARQGKGGRKPPPARGERSR